MARKKDPRGRPPPDATGEDASARDALIDPASLPPETRRIVQSIISYQGPLPPAAELERYNQIVPGAAERILNWVDDERRHRHDIVAADSRRRSFQTIWGMVFGFIVTMTGIGGAILLAMNDHEDTAKVLGGLTLAAIAAVFVTGRLIRVSGKSQD